MALDNEGWARLEAWVAVEFGGRVRKNGLPMAEHSIRVGRALRARGEDDATVFAGYCHDLLEDTDVTEDALRAKAVEFLPDPAAAEAASATAKECCYTDAEYGLPKAERKAAACARWIASPNPRVAPVKIEDVNDNTADFVGVDAAQKVAYDGWALPLRAALEAKHAARPLAGKVVP